VAKWTTIKCSLPWLCIMWTWRFVNCFGNSTDVWSIWFRATSRWIVVIASWSLDTYDVLCLSGGGASGCRSVGCSALVSWGEFWSLCSSGAAVALGRVSTGLVISIIDDGRRSYVTPWVHNWDWCKWWLWIQWLGLLRCCRRARSARLLRIRRPCAAAITMLRRCAVSVTSLSVSRRSKAGSQLTVLLICRSRTTTLRSISCSVPSLINRNVSRSPTNVVDVC